MCTCETIIVCVCVCSLKKWLQSDHLLTPIQVEKQNSIYQHPRNQPCTRVLIFIHNSFFLHEVTIPLTYVTAIYLSLCSLYYLLYTHP